MFAFVRRRPRRTAVLFGTALSIVLIGAVEAFFGVLPRGKREGVTLERVAPVFAPGRATHAALKAAGETVYDVTYTIDEEYRRLTPARPGARRVIAVFGCSFTFGEGVEDAEAFPYVLAELLPDRRVINCGFPGHGPGHMLEQLENEGVWGSFEREGPEKIDVIYVFIPGHVRRAIGSMRVSTSWGKNFPYYDVDGAGKLVRRGTFRTGRPRLQFGYALLAREAILAYYKVDWPVGIGNRELDFTARILARARDLVERRSAAYRFWVVLYPEHPLDEFSARDFRPHLDKYRIKSIDLTDLFEDEASLWLAHDLHPSPHAHALFARALAERIKGGPGPTP